MVVEGRQGAVHVVEDVTGRDDVEHRRPLDPVGTVEAESVGDSGAAVVANDGEPLVAERRHQPGHIGGHRPLGV